jgi:hypothetical protein
MTDDDGTLDRTNGPRTDAAGSMKAAIISDDSVEDLDEEMEKRFGQKRCRNCGE